MQYYIEETTPKQVILLVYLQEIVQDHYFCNTTSISKKNNLKETQTMRNTIYGNIRTTTRYVRKGFAEEFSRN